MNLASFRMAKWRYIKVFIDNQHDRCIFESELVLSEELDDFEYITGQAFLSGNEARWQYLAVSFTIGGHDIGDGKGWDEVSAEEGSISQLVQCYREVSVLCDRCL